MNINKNIIILLILALNLLIISCQNDKRQSNSVMNNDSPLLDSKSFRQLIEKEKQTWLSKKILVQKINNAKTIEEEKKYYTNYMDN